MAGAVLYGAAVLLTNPQAIWSAISQLDARMLAWVVILLGLNYGFRFARWQYYLETLGYRVGLGRSLACYLGAFAFTTTPGKAGEAVRSLYLKVDGVRYADSLAALFTERLLDVLALVLLATSVALLFPAAGWTIGLTAVLVLATVIIIHSPKFHAVAERWLSGRPQGMLVRLSASFMHLLKTASALLRLPRLIGGLGIGIVAWACEGIIFYLILDSMDVLVSPTVALGIWAVSMLVGAISFLPGGLGGTEAAMASLLIIVGTDGPTAVAATMTYRICTLWVAVALGLLIVANLEIDPVREGARPATDNRD